MAARINRKQIPLCKPCHNKVHKGKHQGMTLKNFIYIKWKGTPKWA
jgi:predicted HNH restriction endonuclease